MVASCSFRLLPSQMLFEGHCKGCIHPFFRIGCRRVDSTRETDAVCGFCYIQRLVASSATCARAELPRLEKIGRVKHGEATAYEPSLARCCRKTQYQGKLHKSQCSPCWRFEGVKVSSLARCEFPSPSVTSEHGHVSLDLGTPAHSKPKGEEVSHVDTALDMLPTWPVIL